MSSSFYWNASESHMDSESAVSLYPRMPRDNRFWDRFFTTVHLKCRR